MALALSIASIGQSCGQARETTPVLFAGDEASGYGFLGVVEPGTELLFALEGFGPLADDVRFQRVVPVGLPEYVEYLGAVAIDRREQILIVATAYPPCYPVHPLSALRLSAGDPEGWYVGVVVRINESDPFETKGLEITTRVGGDTATTFVPRIFTVEPPEEGSPVFDQGSPCEEKRDEIESILTR